MQLWSTPYASVCQKYEDQSKTWLPGHTMFRLYQITLHSSHSHALLWLTGRHAYASSITEQILCHLTRSCMPAGDPNDPVGYDHATCLDLAREVCLAALQC